MTKQLHGKWRQGWVIGSNNLLRKLSHLIVHVRGKNYPPLCQIWSPSCLPSIALPVGEYRQRSSAHATLPPAVEPLDVSNGSCPPCFCLITPTLQIPKIQPVMDMSEDVLLAHLSLQLSKDNNEVYHQSFVVPPELQYYHQ